MTDKALANAEQILDVELTQDDEGDFPVGILRAKTSVITTVLNTQAKVDETRLRKVQMDRFPELLKMLDEVKKRLPIDISSN